MRFLVIFGLLLTVVTAQAEIIFSPSISYFKDEAEENGATAETELSTYDFKLAYLGGSGLVLGGMYQMRKTNDNKGSAAGPMIGYSHYSGFYTFLTYFLMAEEERSDVEEMTNGMGPQVDIGWVFPITHSFMIGPQMSYRSITYDKRDVSGTETDADFTKSTILPYVTLWFRF